MTSRFRLFSKKGPTLSTYKSVCEEHGYLFEDSALASAAVAEIQFNRDENRVNNQCYFGLNSHLWESMANRWTQAISRACFPLSLTNGISPCTLWFLSIITLPKGRKSIVPKRMLHMVKKDIWWVTQQGKKHIRSTPYRAHKDSESRIYMSDSQGYKHSLEYVSGSYHGKLQ